MAACHPWWTTALALPVFDAREAVVYNLVASIIAAFRGEPCPFMNMPARIVRRSLISCDLFPRPMPRPLAPSAAARTPSELSRCSPPLAPAVMAPRAPSEGTEVAAVAAAVTVGAASTRAPVDRSGGGSRLGTRLARVSRGVEMMRPAGPAAPIGSASCRDCISSRARLRTGCSSTAWPPQELTLTEGACSRPLDLESATHPRHRSAPGEFLSSKEPWYNRRARTIPAGGS